MGLTKDEKQSKTTTKTRYADQWNKMEYPKTSPQSHKCSCLILLLFCSCYSILLGSETKFHPSDPGWSIMCFVAHIGLHLTVILLFQPPKHWENRYEAPCQENHLVFLQRWQKHILEKSQHLQQIASGEWGLHVRAIKLDPYLSPSERLCPLKKTGWTR